MYFPQRWIWVMLHLSARAFLIRIQTSKINRTNLGSVQVTDNGARQRGSKLREGWCQITVVIVADVGAHGRKEQHQVEHRTARGSDRGMCSRWAQKIQQVVRWFVQRHKITPGEGFILALYDILVSNSSEYKEAGACFFGCLWCDGTETNTFEIKFAGIQFAGVHLNWFN